MLKSLVRGLMVPAVALAAMLPISASAAGGGGGGASNGMTITIGSPITLQSRLLVTVPVTVTCVAPISVDPTVFPPGSIDVTVEQASGSSVTSGFGGAELDSCSPTPQTFLVQVTPNLSPGGSTAAFHGGPAILTASGAICDFTTFPETCFFGSTPWEATRL